MINKPPSFKGLNIRIPTIFPIRGRGLINHRSTSGKVMTAFGVPSNTSNGDEVPIGVILGLYWCYIGIM